MGYSSSIDSIKFNYSFGSYLPSSFSDSYAPSYSFDFKNTYSYTSYSLDSWRSYSSYAPKSYAPTSYGTDFSLKSYELSYKPFGSVTSYSPKNSYGPSLGSYNTGMISSRRPAARFDRTYNFTDVGSVKGDSYFDEALKFVLKWEGGYANVKGDSGGETNKGITHATYQAWLKKNGKPSKSVKNITDDEVRQIYYNEFWKPLGCDKLPSKVALFMFDTGVNMGVGRAKEYLNRYNNGESLDSLVKARDNRYDAIVASNPEKGKFRKGWDNRMTDLKSTMLAVA